VEVFGWIEPEKNSFFPVVETICINICLEYVWLPGDIAKELEVYLISVRLIRTELHSDVLSM